MFIFNTTRKNYFRAILIIVSLMFSSFVYSQEICNNGIDDDADGLVDLNDVANCTCTPATTTVPSLIPNPSFETMACCPSSYSQVSCASGWIQATSATSDYMNTCGFVFGAATSAGLLPFPDGNGIIGTIFSPGWQEYVGSCLTAPMVAGTSYSVQMNIASTPIDGSGGVCNGGVIDFGPIDIVLFGAANCSALPAGGTGCPGAPWVALGSATYTPTPSWGTITITFTPTVNINTIMIGSPCALPASYSPPSGCYPYFYYDNMLLNTTTAFTTTIAQTGTWCGNTLQITGNALTGATYQWYLAGVAIVGQTGLVLNVSALGLPVGNYSIVTTLGGTCSVASTTVIATAVAPIITPAGPFCSNAVPVNLVADIPGGNWAGTGITNASLGTFTPSAATIGNNTITYTTAGTCPRVDTITILVNALPISNAGSDVTILGGAITICTGTATTIGTTTTVGYTYSWALATGLSSTVISNPAITTVNPGSVPITTTYTVTTTANSCTSTDTVTVNVNPLPSANAGPAQTICIGSTATLAGTVGGAATSGIWSGGAGTYSPSNTNLNAIYTPTVAEETAGSVTLTLTTDDPIGPCPVATSTTTITINPAAVINAGPNQTICIGTTATLGGVISGSAISGTWTGGAGTYSTSNTDPLAIYTPTATEETTGTVTLTFTSDDPAGPCPAVNDQMIITIAPLPFTNAGLDQTICDGTSATLSGTISGAATSATWTGGAGLFSPNNTTLNATYTPTVAEATTGFVTLTITTDDPAGPCTFATDQMIITINPLATINAGLDQTICIGNSATLAGVIGGSATSGSWTGGAGTYTPSAATANAVYTPTVAEAAAGTVTLIFTSNDPAGPCSAVIDQMTITINQLPTANAGSSQSVCSGSSITLAGLIGGSATSGTWGGGAGTYSPNASTLNAVYTPTAAEYIAGSVALTLTTDDPIGPCTFSTSTVTFLFYQNPVVSFSANNLARCPINCVKFTDLSTIGGGDAIVSWIWNFGEGGTSSIIPNPENCYEITGFYDVTLTVISNNSCSTTLVMPSYIQVFPKPVAEFIPTPNPATMLESVVTLNNASSSDVTSWWYYFGDGYSVNPNISSPVHIYPNVVANTYLATLIVENIYGCKDTAEHFVEIAPEFTFYIPNAFSPNDDGVNDFFFGKGIGIVDYDLFVFDRWGNLIFHGNNINDMWNGKANNGSEIAQQDVYVWKVKLTDVFNKKHNYIGTVTLVK